MALDCEMEEYKCCERVDRLGAEPGQGMGGGQLEGEGDHAQGCVLGGSVFAPGRRRAGPWPVKVKVSPATDPQSSGGERLVS